MLIIKHNWDDESVQWSEDDIQAALVTCLRRLEKALNINGMVKFKFAADQNGAKRSFKAGARAKALGMERGETDLRIYLPGGRIWLPELKVKKTGRVSPDQVKRHRDLEKLGHDVRLVFAATPFAAIETVISGLANRLGLGYDYLMVLAKPKVTV